MAPESPKVQSFKFPTQTPTQVPVVQRGTMVGYTVTGVEFVQARYDFASKKSMAQAGRKKTDLKNSRAKTKRR